MTTIVYRDGVLASDSRETADKTIIRDNSRKILRLYSGALLGLSGSVPRSRIFLRWIMAAERKAKKEGVDPVLPNEIVKGIEAILVDNVGTLWIYESGAWANPLEHGMKYYAIGSGYLPAMAAMDAGADAVTAVKIGIKRDIYSGGRVQKLTLNG